MRDAKPAVSIWEESGSHAHSKVATCVPDRHLPWRCRRSRQSPRSPSQPTGCTSGTALVFNPNPVVTSGNQNLTDQDDADYAALNNERVSVPLVGLDGSGYLRGTWATVVSETGNPAYETDCTCDYTRHDDRFEQVMAYYWITKSQLYTRGLGFGVNAGWPAINGDQQRVRINQWGADNSFATDHPKDEMRFGKGGVDDAEDAEVILHELGHQIHFSASADVLRQQRGRVGISEGFGDYWAATVSEWAAGVQPDPACICRLGRHFLRPDGAGTACAGSIRDLSTRQTSTARCTATARSGHTRCGTCGPRSARHMPTRPSCGRRSAGRARTCPTSPTAS